MHTYCLQRGEKAATAKGKKKAATAKGKKKAATAKAKEVDFGLRDWFKFGQDAPVQLRKGRLKALKKNAPLGALSKQRHRKAAAQPAALPVRPLGVPRLSGGLSSFFSAVIHLPPVAAMVCPVSACGKPGAFMSLAARVLKPVYGSGPMKPLVDAAEKVISTYGHAHAHVLQRFVGLLRPESVGLIELFVHGIRVGAHSSEYTFVPVLQGVPPLRRSVTLEQVLCVGVRQPESVPVVLCVDLRPPAEICPLLVGPQLERAVGVDFSHAIAAPITYGGASFVVCSGVLNGDKAFLCPLFGRVLRAGQSATGGWLFDGDHVCEVDVRAVDRATVELLFLVRCDRLGDRSSAFPLSLPAVDTGLPKSRYLVRGDSDFTPKAYILSRVEKLVGKTEAQARAMFYLHASGQLHRYSKGDLAYDIAHGFLKWYYPATFVRPRPAGCDERVRSGRGGGGGGGGSGGSGSGRSGGGGRSGKSGGTGGDGSWKSGGTGGDGSGGTGGDGSGVWGGVDFGAEDGAVADDDGDSSGVDVSAATGDIGREVLLPMMRPRWPR